MLPQINNKFEAFIAPAKAQRGGWFVILGLCLIVLFYLEFMYLFLFLVSLATGDTGNIAQDFNGIAEMLANADTPFSIIVALGSFLGMLGGVSLAVYVLREQSPMSVIGTGPVIKNMLIAAAILGTVSTVGSIIALLSFELVPNIPIGDWLIWMPLALPLLFVQIAAEEMIFRGYLQQELAARYKSPLIWLIVPSLVFGSLHWDPDTFGPNAWLIIVSTTLFGIIAADVTARTGNLGAALGLHFANNFFALYITSMQGTLTGLSLYLTPFDASDTDSVRQLLFMDIGLVFTAYMIYLAVIRLNRKR